jgi:type IV fimbrial biogenesis protein FimT
MEVFMRHQQGFTLPELLTTIAIAAILMALAAPSFTQLVRNSRLEGVVSRFIDNTNTARSYAVKSNARVTMSSQHTWNNGWQIHYDPNHNGQLDPGEQILVSAAPIPDGLDIEGNRSVADYISYLGTGESHWASGEEGGAFQAGTITVCPHSNGGGFQLILSRGGRLRKEPYGCDGST